MINTKNIDRNSLSPMLLQYVEIKDKYQNDIVMFRVGDFFEAYFEDALLISQICGLRFTAKRIGSKEKSDKQVNLYSTEDEKLSKDEIMNSKTLIPMAGVPHKSLNNYAQQLISAGYRVIVVEQLEDPKTVKGRTVKRDIVSIMSGMNKEGEFLTEYLNNFIGVVTKEKNTYGICFADISTSDVFLTNVFSIDEVLNEIFKYKPSEIIVNSELAILLDNSIKDKLRIKTMLTIDEACFASENIIEEIVSSFRIDGIDRIAYNSVSELKALSALINYVEFTQKIKFSFGKLPICYDADRYMSIDMYSRSNLELTENSVDKTRNGTLLSVLDSCKTSMGSRLLKQWIDRPLQNTVEINNRLDGVSELVINEDILTTLQEDFFGILDISRIMGRLRLNRSIPRDLVNLRESLRKIPKIKESLKNLSSSIFKDIYKNMYAFEDLAFLLDKALLDDPAGDVKEGLVLKPGYNKELDTARDMIENSNKYLDEFENREKENTGIKALKVVNKNGRCTIEIPKAYYDKVPSNYRIEKALKSSTRYTTDESEKLERRLFSAIERSKSIEIELYNELKEVILEEYYTISQLCEALSTLDVICSFSNVARNNNYIRPELNTLGIIKISNGRHPVVEKYVENFVENDSEINLSNRKFMLITGPNMAGKSTYMRQIALIVLMAHIGSFVPATEANISITDKIFTRIGASDDISSGRSTYMVEMTEVKNILDNATVNSLVLLDEVGRGTSTSDGLSIAQAISEYIYDKIGCKTLFATHYHELIALENQFAGLKNYHMSVNKESGNLEFIRKIKEGGLSESYGIDVAKLAGIPDSVINRARDILELIDGKTQEKLQEDNKKDKNNHVIEELMSLDKTDLTPISAYRILSELIDKIKELI